MLRNALILGVVGMLLAMTYTPMQHRSPQWELAYGAVTYALAIVAALLVGVVARLPMRRLRLLISSVALAFLLMPPLFGSVAIAYALVQLVGNRAEGSDVMWGLCLWARVSLPLAWFARRAAAHG